MSESVHYYTVYGITIRSSLSLPELTAIPALDAPDVNISIGRIDRPMPELAPDGRYRRTTAGEIHFYWPLVGGFLAMGGQEILIEPAAEIQPQVLRLFLLGPVLAALVHQRGLLMLHASAVEMDGAAVGFLGAARRGKSTMAAALRARGYKLVADDVLAVRFGVGRVEVWPGFPQLKLWPDAAAAVGDDPDLLRPLSPGGEKRARPVPEGVAAVPLALRCLYVLAEGPAPLIEPLPAQQAFVELLRHSYTWALLQGTGASASHLGQCGALVNALPVRLLARPRSLAALGQVAAMVEADVARLQGASIQT